MKKIFCPLLCTICLLIGAIVGSIITKDKVQKEMEYKNHIALIQELDDISDNLLESTSIAYAGLSYNMDGEQFSPDTYYYKVAEQTARIVSKFLDNLDKKRRLDGTNGEYLYPWKDNMILIRKEAESISKLYKKNPKILSISPWENEITIEKDYILPHIGPKYVSTGIPKQVESAL